LELEQHIEEQHIERREAGENKATESAVNADASAVALSTVTAERRLEILEDQLAKVAKTVGAPLVARVSAGDDNEDRKRLKEKLKAALESYRRRRLRPIVSEQEVWVEYIFGICKPDHRNGKQGNRLIHPNSRFAQGMLFLTGLFLFYTAIIVPVQIFVWDYSDPCETYPSLRIDLFVDSYFLFDVFMQFVIGSFDDSQTLLSDLKLAAKRNFTSLGGFWFDCITSVPWSYLDYQAYLACFQENEITQTKNSNSRLLRIIKILRMLKILRLLRAVKIIE